MNLTQVVTSSTGLAILREAAAFLMRNVYDSCIENIASNIIVVSSLQDALLKFKIAELPSKQVQTKTNSNASKDPFFFTFQHKN
jgi:hypothetical protein